MDGLSAVPPWTEGCETMMFPAHAAMPEDLDDRELFATIRRRAGVAQADIAQVLRSSGLPVYQSDISRWERGQPGRAWTAETAALVWEALSIAVSEAAAGTEAVA